MESKIIAQKIINVLQAEDVDKDEILALVENIPAPEKDELASMFESGTVGAARLNDFFSRVFTKVALKPFSDAKQTVLDDLQRKLDQRAEEILADVTK